MRDSLPPDPQSQYMYYKCISSMSHETARLDERRKLSKSPANTTCKPCIPMISSRTNGEETSVLLECSTLSSQALSCHCFGLVVTATLVLNQPIVIGEVL